MTGFALVLVIGSAFLHGIWNLLYKRAKDKPAFAWLFGLLASILYLPVFLVLLGLEPVSWNAWPIVLASGILHTLYFAFVGRGYSAGDLSLVYPLARGTGPLLVPIWAIPLLGERLSIQGFAGILLVVSGVYILHLKEVSWRGLAAPLLSVKTRATRLALFSGLLISLFSVVDKVGVSYFPPIIFMYMFMSIFALVYGPYVLRTRGLAVVRDEWRVNAWSIVAVAFLVVFTYGLVLFAMTMSNVSYVAAAREMSVVFVAALGAFLLKESYGRTKIVGSILIALGVALIGLARS